MMEESQCSEDEKTEQWIRLTEGKQLSRLLYTNPVCFLTTVSKNSPKRNVMVLSWLTATNNEGSLMCSINRRRHTASALLSGVSEFVLSVPVRGMEKLVLDVGHVSGRWGSKFPQDHNETPEPLPATEEHLSKRQSKKRTRTALAYGVPGLEAVLLSDSSEGTPEEQPFAIRGTVAHLNCSIYKVLEDAIDDDHLLILARIQYAQVHPSYWDSSKNLFRAEAHVCPYLSFIGSQRLGYVVSELP